MVPEAASCLVGLITIEAVPQQPGEAIAPRGEGADATLGQFLLYLAGGSAKRGEPAVLAGKSTAAEPPSGPLPLGRFEAATMRAWQQPMRLSADLKSLTAQLEQAVSEVRRQVAVARRLGG